MRKTQDQIANAFGVSKSTVRRRQTKRRYMQYSEEERNEALALLDEGYPALEVSNILDIPRTTILNWRSKR